MGLDLRTHKDVLSIFFGLLALGTYVRAATGGRRLNLVLSFFFLALSLMAKQTLVTLPFVFLLLDFWPLGRWQLARGPLPGAEAPALPSQPTSIRRLIVEHLPFFGLSVAFSVVAASVQARGGAIQQAFPFSVRCMNVVVVYATYLEKTLIPIDLAVYYPHPGFALSLPLGVTRVIVSGLVLLVVSTVAVLFLRRLPYLFVGWCWYLGTLVPMIGFVQIGTQQMADRYTYFPLIGIFLAVTWLVADRTPAGVWRARVLPGVAAILVIALGITSFHQIGYWRDTITLFRHALTLAPDHPNSHEHLGGAYLYAGMPEKAIPEPAERLWPNRAVVHGLLRVRTGERPGQGGPWQRSLCPLPGGTRARRDIRQTAQRFRRPADEPASGRRGQANDFS